MLGFVSFNSLFDGSALPGLTQDSTMLLRAAALRTASIVGVHLRELRRGAAPAASGKGCAAAAVLA
jgi:hypothetical protein